MDALERRHDEISIRSRHRQKARTLVCRGLDSDSVFKLLNVIDDCRKVGAENGVGGTDAEAGAGQEAAHFITGRGRLSI